MSATGDATMDDAGTTLIEALVVVGITAMVALIGFPRLQRSLATMAEQQTVASVATGLRQARATALRGDGTVAFAVAGGGREYGMGGGPVAHAAPGVTLTAASARGGRILFYGDGSSSGGVVLVHGAKRTTAVEVRAWGGAVAVAP